MSRWNLCWLLGFVGVGLVSMSLAYTAPTRETRLHQKHENLKLMVDVLEEVQQKYVKELDSEKIRELVENMINGGLERLDQHSQFHNAEEYKRFMSQSRGRFGGIGIRIGIDRGRVIVESPIVGTPAYEAGILAGDVIMKVDGHSTENMSMKEVVEKIQGEPGTKVKITVLHEGSKKLSDAVDLEITRAEINIDSVLGDRRNPINLKEWDFWVDPALKIAYVRLVAFTETTTAELTRVVDALQKLGMRGLVLDLRGNPGGLLRAAVEVSSMFLPEGKRIVTTKNRNGREEVYNSRAVENHPPATSYPIAILINRYSASASEIVAAALQDHLRAIIVGERSYGKGSVQNIIPMEGGASALKLTTASYWRPNGRNIHRFPESKEEEEWGVRPSKGYEVKLTDDERIAYMKDRQKRDVVRRPAQDAPKDNGDAKAEPFKDRVLEKAVEYLRQELNRGVAPAGARGAFRVDPGLLPPPNRNAERPEPVFNAA